MKMLGAGLISGAARLWQASAAAPAQSSISFS